MKTSKNYKFDLPHGNATVWRYMGLDKFLDLVTKKNLFFTRLSNLTDQFEGNIIKGGESLGVKKYEIHDLRELTFVNCWSIAPHESFALWKIYLSDSKSGVAIKTSFGRLRKAIIVEDDIYAKNIRVNKVSYADSIPYIDNDLYSLITTKKKFYDFENELRLFIKITPDILSHGGISSSIKGFNINIDLSTLIDRVYLSPFIPEWFNATIREIINKVSPGLNNKIINSEIKDQW